MIFKGMVIRLKGPICDCRKEDLWWHIYVDQNGKYGLTIYCGRCQTVIRIPHDKFVGGFLLDKGYPGGLRRSNLPRKEVGFSDFDREFLKEHKIKAD